MTGANMAGGYLTIPERARLSSSSITPSFADLRETSKRKRADDDTGLPLNSDTELQTSKRQKYVPHCNESNAGGSREYFSRDESMNEESRESQRIDPLVRQNIYMNEKTFD